MSCSLQWFSVIQEFGTILSKLPSSAPGSFCLPPPFFSFSFRVFPNGVTLPQLPERPTTTQPCQQTSFRRRTAGGDAGGADAAPRARRRSRRWSVADAPAAFVREPRAPARPRGTRRPPLPPAAAGRKALISKIFLTFLSDRLTQMTRHYSVLGIANLLLNNLVYPMSSSSE